MADVENKNVNDSLGDAVHKDGTDYIKEQLAGKSAEGTTAAASESKPENVAPITPAQPPASNPGAEDPTAGIAKDAGGVSSAAHVQSPTTANKEKRKSIVGQLTGFLGFGGKKEKEAKNASEDSTVGGYTTGAATSVAGTTTVLADRTKTAVHENTGIDLGATSKEAANTDTVGSGANVTEDTPTTSTTRATTENADTPSGKNETDTSGEDSHKPPKPADPKTMENKDAIPVAGGEKLGEKHWGESKIVPDNPKPQTEQGGVASTDGQPSKEVSDNTAKNTGGATGGPSGSKSPDSEKKDNFMDKLKDKFKGGKKDKQ